MERLLSVSIEATSNEVGMPDSDILGLVIAAVSCASKMPCNRKSTVCLMQHVAQALKAAGW